MIRLLCLGEVVGIVFQLFVRLQVLQSHPEQEHSALKRRGQQNLTCLQNVVVATSITWLQKTMKNTFSANRCSVLNLNSLNIVGLPL